MDSPTSPTSAPRGERSRHSQHHGAREYGSALASHSGDAIPTNDISISDTITKDVATNGVSVPPSDVPYPPESAFHDPYVHPDGAIAHGIEGELPEDQYLAPQPEAFPEEAIVPLVPVTVDTVNPRLISEITRLRGTLSLPTLSPRARARVASELKGRLATHAQGLARSRSQVKAQWAPDFTAHSFSLDGVPCTVNVPDHPLYPPLEEPAEMSLGRAFDYEDYLDAALSYLAQPAGWIPDDDLSFDRLYHIVKLQRIMPYPPRAIARARRPPFEPDNVREDCLVLSADGSVFVYVRNELYPPLEDAYVEPQPSAMFNASCVETMRAYHRLLKEKLREMVLPEYRPQRALPPPKKDKGRRRGRTAPATGEEEKEKVAGEEPEAEGEGEGEGESGSARSSRGRARSRSASPTAAGDADGEGDETAQAAVPAYEDSDSDSEAVDDALCEADVSAIAASAFPAVDTPPEEQAALVHAALQDSRVAPFFLLAKKSVCYLNLPVIFEFPLRVGLEADDTFPLIPDSLIAGRYVIVRQIGAAAFSRAVEVHDLVSNARLCLKVMHNKKDLVDQCLDEVKVLQLLNKHDPKDMFHIVRMRGVFYYKEHLFLGSELLGCNLHDVAKIVWDPRVPATAAKLDGHFYYSLRVLRKMARQILIALWYLRCFGVLHCDLKPENILMQDWATARIKLIDFGSAAFLHDNMTTYIQSRSYRAPEVILGLPCMVPSALDMWSLGCVLYELYTNKVLFSTRSLPVILAKMQATLGPVPPDMIQNSRFGPRYFRAVPVPLPASLAHYSGSNALIFQTYQRRPAESPITRNSHWSRFAPPDNETQAEAAQRLLAEEAEWTALDNITGPVEEELGSPYAEEALLDPRPTSLLQRVLLTARQQRDLCLAAGGTPALAPKDDFDPLDDEIAAVTCHPTRWPGYKLRTRDWSEDTPSRIAQFMMRRKVTSVKSRTEVIKAHVRGNNPHHLDVEALHNVLTDKPVTDTSFPANPAFPRPQFFGPHHPGKLPPHDSPALFANFLCQLLRYRPEERPTPEQALLHPFLWPVDEDEEWDL